MQLAHAHQSLLVPRRDSRSAPGLAPDLVPPVLARGVRACAAVLKGRVDGIVLTGGLAHAAEFIDRIKDHVAFLGPVFVFPGENEMAALAEAGRRVLGGEDEARTYPA